MSFQDIKTLRNLIEKIPVRHIRNCLKFQYLTGARISEVCGSYAITKKDMIEDRYVDEYFNEDAILFSLKTAKREGQRRIIAIPLDKKYEVWIENLVKYFQSRKGNKVFNFTPRTVQRYCCRYINTLEYSIKKYRGINGHNRKASTHALRHVRASDLSMNYGFDSMDLNMFFGWTIAGMAQRYITLNWRRYFPKLLKVHN